MKKWWALFALLFFLCIDFWNWSKSEPVILFMPYWMWYIFVLCFVMAMVFALFAKYEWREEQ
ncbi:hypothetical protein B6U81_01315 [Thermoplasmatales archaeon ex4484_30]|nr:MAG: hypothetical protein FE041_03545 [Thermoplasmata archaeon]OYT62229.1 MAG: hypothetical protein B6U81_01315 [Thermoplasmatales archaeon ex4484_30]